MFTWNDQQLAAIDGIVQFVNSPFNSTDPEFAITIVGFAGTGKTTLVQEAIRRVQEVNPNIQVAVTAPTNKATQVLADFGKDVGVIVETKTIYSLLGLVLGENGEVKTVYQGSEGTFANFDVVIVDEASMVGNMLMDTLKTRAEHYGVKVVFMGDNCQLNPVKERQSRAFSTEEISTMYYLNKVMRQDEGSPIRKAISQVRELADKGVEPDKFSTETTRDGDGIHVIVGREFEETMIAQFNCEEYKKDPKFVKALAWTNREVDRLNNIIRKAIYGNDCDDFVVGETVSVLSPVTDENNVPAIFTNDECKILAVGVGSITDTLDFETLDAGNPTYKVWVLELETPYSPSGSCKVFVLHRDSERKYKKRLDYLAKQAKAKKKTWRDFWNFHDMFTRARPAHALTIHNSQGSTYETVFFNAKDASNNRNNKERARLAYVAMSRAKTNLVINKARIY